MLPALPLAALTGGREVADDAPELLRLVREPFALWGSYMETGLHRRWGSFPPLLPPLFGLPIRPLLGTIPDFWAIRVGVLAWGALAYVWLAGEVERDHAGANAARTACWLFALLPSVWCAIALIPQEEIYVGLFALGLYRLARERLWGWIPLALAATALSAKYFLLILILPLALYSPLPLRNLVLWCAAGFGTLGAYVGYHLLAHGTTPILSHLLTPEGSISLWALLWYLDWLPRMELVPLLEWVKNFSILLTGLSVLALSAWARARGVPLAFALAASLFATLLLVSITFPAYVLWALPLALVCLARIGAARERAALAALLALWGVAEWGANFFRGVGFALAAERETGKEAVAAHAEAWFGAGFPYEGATIACIALVLASGAGIVALLLGAGRAGGAGPAPGGSTRPARL